MSVKLKPGYKQTEVGMIPEDWEVLPLGAVADFLDGKRRPVKDSERAKMIGDFPYYGASGIVDYVNDYLFDEDLILLGEDGENILSRNCRLAFRVSGKIWVNNHAHVLKPKEGMDIGYLTEYLESRDYCQYNTGTAQPKLNKHICSSIPVIAPSLAEQRAISTALSDVDALLNKLDQLISKKHDIKQAAMQQLLTGKQRLPGFQNKDGFKQTAVGLIPEDWLAEPLGTHVRITSGESPTRFTLNNAGTPFFKVEQLNNDEKFLEKTPYYFDCDKTVDSGSIIFPKRGASILLNKVRILKQDSFMDTNLMSLTVGESLDNEFLFYALIHLELWRIADMTSIPQINNKHIKPFVLPFPELVEQRAISRVLADIDAEIACLEQRREKTHALKQGMMQELLTGRIRLI